MLEVNWEVFEVTDEYDTPVALMSMIRQWHSDFSQSDIQLHRIRTNEAEVQFLVQLVETRWLNRFTNGNVSV